MVVPRGRCGELLWGGYQAGARAAMDKFVPAGGAGKIVVMVKMSAFDKSLDRTFIVATIITGWVKPEPQMIMIHHYYLSEETK